ncbi:exodeoxyribonuclease VII small subunit [Thalassotalea marina]|uniref:Exodeoxyribonuclease 7 small subunit n=1 Tax=Thalassotalea marina TaxID=1673741 RepID=A0A919EIM1_9GAMM|nr:exodeoxyribonuclease VII small subunit [Thalassotalea marina]GHF83177.1 exodeoxyribonuclease 7 small subunit [Thalassotalea marina]
MARKKIENLSFEEALVELESIVDSLEKGDLNLEDSMTLFERGLSLSQISQVKLKDAEQKVQILMQRHQDSSLADFQPEETE